MTSDNNIQYAQSRSFMQSPLPQDLIQLRQKIDSLDEKLLQLINQRGDFAMQVAEFKRAQDSELADYYKPEREAQVLRRIMQLNHGPLQNETIGQLFREIMSACLALEQPIKVAYLGPEGTFTERAALKHFGQFALRQPLPAIDDVFREVESHAVGYGVVPVENSTEGVVNHTLDSFVNSSLKICGEVMLRIHHYLMIGPQTRRDKITVIYSHSQSLAQCRQWLDAHYPHAERIAVSSNAEAARLVRGEWHSAAIAGDMAAQLYNLTIIAENIEDRPDNSTRFLMIAPHDVTMGGTDKTSLLFSVRNQPGALYHLITPLKTNNIDMMRIETRPSRTTNWDYLFFIDIKGHRQDPHIAQAIEQMERSAVYMKILGSYPTGVL